MTSKKIPLYYGKCACDTMMRRYQAKDLPPKGHFHYHQGVFLSGMYKIYQLCGAEKYFQYIKDWVDSNLNEEGMIKCYDSGQLDDIQPGILLYPLLERTGEKKYQKALERLMDSLRNYPCNQEGGFWHKACYPNQMWLDGLYMAGPISAEYGAKFQVPEYLESAVSQALMMRKKTEDVASGLWHHAWDCSKKAVWADPETGLSPEFWGRAIGWVPVAVLDELDYIPENHADRQTLCGLVGDLLTAVCRYQSQEGRWYQVVDKGGQEGNWLENSCSCLYVAALCKAVRKGILDKKFLEIAIKGYEAVIQDVSWRGEDIQIGNVCIGTGVGNYQHYCSRPTSVNDLHGIGAFLLMCSEAQQMLL